MLTIKLPLLAAALFVSAAVTPQQTPPLVVEAHQFTVEGVWGTSVVMGVNRAEHWASRVDELPILDGAPGRVSSFIREVCANTTGASMDLEPYFALASAVPPFISDQPEWEVEVSQHVRDVSHSGGVTLNTIQPSDPQGVPYVVCVGADFALHGAFGHTPIMWTSEEGADVYGFYNELMAPFPVASVPGGTWLSAGPWVSEVGAAPHSGNHRVALRSVIPNSPENAIGAHMYVFEQIAGVMVPVLSFVHDNEVDEYSWCAYSYGLQPSPNGGLMPFPNLAVEFEVNEHFLRTKRTMVRYVGETDGLSAVKFPFAPNADLWPQPGILEPGEGATFKASDPSSWPSRISSFMSEI